MVGYGMSGDAYHITAPTEDGDGAYRVMCAALESAGIAPETVDYINAHGTSTPHNDRIETIAIKRAFGDHAHKLLVSSTEVDDRPPARRRRRPRGRHHRARDATIRRCRRRSTWCSPMKGSISTTCRTSPRETAIRYALSNSFGFGGTNGSLLFKKFED